MGTSSFSPCELFRAMAPIDLILESFQSYYSEESDHCHSGQSTWVNEDSQEKFALLLKNIIKTPHTVSGEYIKFSPTDRYIRKVLSKFVAKVEENSCMIESDELVELMMEYQMKPGVKNDSMPDPNEWCYVSFQLPVCNNLAMTRNTNYNDVVGIKVFPYHNDVGVRKVWEAGAALAEFFLVRPDLIKDKSVLELGAGVGLTGIIISGLCEPKSVHLTDYTDATLINMEHNISVNKTWIKNTRCGDYCAVTSVSISAVSFTTRSIFS
jgi:protein-lysine N-methyltransferase EEF2KMT